MICFCFSYLQIVNGSGADHLQFVFGVTASIALRNRRRNWLLYRLRVGGGLLSAVAPDSETLFFHGCSFPHKPSVPCAK